jgi:hypothetical protein
LSVATRRWCGFTKRFEYPPGEAAFGLLGNNINSRVSNIASQIGSAAPC